MLGRMGRIVCYAAVSADGFIADADGGVAWLDPFNSPELGYEAFVDGVGAVVLGRRTYDQALTFGPWPYVGKAGLVVTSQPLSSLPDRTQAVTPADLPAMLAALRDDTPSDVWIVGGGRTARLCLDAALIDALELYRVPLLLGDGVPLFARLQRRRWLELRDTRTFENGLLRECYSIAR
jgi:dihydrofolate reductase